MPEVDSSNQYQGTLLYEMNNKRDPRELSHWNVELKSWEKS